MNKQERTCFCLAFFGTNRTGKSSVAHKIAEDWRASRPKSHTIVSFDPQGRFKDISDAIIDPEDKEWAFKLHELRNCLIIFDDFGELNDGDKPHDGLKTLMYHRDDWNIDMIHIYHNPKLILNVMAYYTNRYYIFMTNVQKAGFRDKIPNAELCQNASARVNRYVSIFGKGKHRKDPEYAKQGFPHIIVDCESQKLIAVNMDKQLSKINLTKK